MLLSVLISLTLDRYFRSNHVLDLHSYVDCILGDLCIKPTNYNSWPFFILIALHFIGSTDSCYMIFLWKHEHLWSLGKLNLSKSSVISFVQTAREEVNYFLVFPSERQCCWILQCIVRRTELHFGWHAHARDKETRKMFWDAAMPSTPTSVWINRYGAEGCQFSCQSGWISEWRSERRHSGKYSL